MELQTKRNKSLRDIKNSASQPTPEDGEEGASPDFSQINRKKPLFVA
jgi:hypothetical protein